MLPISMDYGWSSIELRFDDDSENCCDPRYNSTQFSCRLPSMNVPKEATTCPDCCLAVSIRNIHNQRVRKSNYRLKYRWNKENRKCCWNSAKKHLCRLDHRQQSDLIFAKVDALSYFCILNTIISTNFHLNRLQLHFNFLIL